MYSRVTVVVRTLNEREKLKELLVMLSEQRASLPIEIIVVDNESHDGTPELAESMGAKVINLPREQFSYPRSMNMGLRAATGDIVILTVGHALPIRTDWVERAISAFLDSDVAGLYSPVIPRRNGTVTDWILLFPGYLKALIIGKRKIRKIGPGVFAATNCALLKKDWDEENFNEKFELGGEDTLWASRQIQRGKAIVCDPKFTVRHCHYLNLKGGFAQMKYWMSLRKPTKFSRDTLRFRSDLDFS